MPSPILLPHLGPLHLQCSLLAASPGISPVPVTCSMSLVRSLFSHTVPSWAPLPVILTVSPRLFFVVSSQVWEHPVASQAELALTLKVLGTLSDSALGDILDQPLCTLYPSAPSSWPVSGLGPRPAGLWLWSLALCPGPAHALFSAHESQLSP